MNFYLKKYGFIDSQISAEVHPETNIIVVIPCFNEPDLTTTLNSLALCENTSSYVEVIVVFNSGEHHPAEIIEANQKSVRDFEAFVKNYKGELSFLKIEQNELPKKHAGVGLARKIGMDEAVSRFYKISHDGIIVCFDADAQVDSNYLIEIEKHFESNPKSPGCSVHYEHPIKGEEFEQAIYKGITNYELHLRYYNQCMRYADLPYAYHTVGSSMAVRSSAYQKQGGMNKRKAGEDFYFIHKIIALGEFTELKSTKVIPSPRISDRVPFGTGKAIGDWIESKEEEYYTYNFLIFKEVKLFISMIPKFYEPVPYLRLFSLHPAFVEYFEGLDFQDKLDEMKSNTKDYLMFKKRFFVWFDAFQLLKLVHFVQKAGFGDEKLNKSVNQMLAAKHALEPVESEVDQLLLLRQIEKS